jgi:integrase
VARRVKTSVPGVYKRGNIYTFSYRDGNGRQRWESPFRTMDLARKAKAKRETELADGTYHPGNGVTLHGYAREWVERYHGRGRRGFREGTRDGYRRSLNTYALKYFGPRVKVTDLTPRHIAQYVAWLCEQTSARGKPLSDNSVRNAVIPLRACLATAMAEGLIRSNPTHGVSLPHRPTADGLEQEDVRVLSRDQLAAFLDLVHPRHRLMFRFLATTGVRAGELIALQWRHVALDGSQPHVQIRRSIVKGRVEPPKSKHGKREIPLDAPLVLDLRAHRADSEWPGENDLVFPSLAGTPLKLENVRRRVIKPVAQEIDAGWCGFQTFRHTCASLLFARGADASPAVARPPLPELHARPLHPSAPRRPGRAARPHGRVGASHGEHRAQRPLRVFAWTSRHSSSPAVAGAEGAAAATPRAIPAVTAHRAVTTCVTRRVIDAE